MFAELLSPQYDFYHPEYSLTLINSIRSYINSKLDHERKSLDFIKDLQRKLYCIHEYNCLVSKVTHEYPRSRKLDLLLIKYVELEYDVLYNNACISRQLEVATELRVLRLLQVILYPAVLANQPFINNDTDRALKKVVLELLEEVRPTYLVKNRLVYNIAQKLLKIIGGEYKNVHCRSKSILATHKPLATSDYGSDDSDIDVENNVVSKDFSSRGRISAEGNTDCVEVPLSTNGATSIPTIEFTDDDDNYFVYLQKSVAVKRKNTEDTKAHHRRKVSVKGSQPITSPNVQNSSKKSTSNDSCVILSSDSEDEGGVDHQRITKRQELKKSAGVVTFEILDDDDDGQTNYMVYLQKEVESTKKHEQNKVKKEIIICTDSEDETCEIETSSEIGKADSSEESTKLPKDLCSDNQMPEVNNTMHTTVCVPNVSHHDKNRDNSLDLGDKERDNTNQNKIDLNSMISSMENINVDTKLTVTDNTNKSTQSSSQPTDDQVASTSIDANPCVKFSKEVSPFERYFVNPSLIFKEVRQIEMNHEECFTNVSESSGFQESDSPGGPVLGEKNDCLEELGNVSECRINESFIEELLLDDTYLLEGRKEFEELEYFLFNDTAEKSGFNFSNHSFDESDTLQPETFHADIKMIESFLDDSQLIDPTDLKHSSGFNSVDLLSPDNRVGEGSLIEQDVNSKNLKSRRFSKR